MTLKSCILITSLLALASCGYNSTKVKSNGSGSSTASSARGASGRAQQGGSSGTQSGGGSQVSGGQTPDAPSPGTSAQEPPVDPNSPPDEIKLTFEDIKSTILESNCVACHNENRSTAGINVNTYQGMIANVDRVEAAILQGFMPPSGPLSDADKELFKQWLADGAIEQ